ncbi:MAG: ABC transporter permease, partial [Cyclobacteriaceae bacterium]|nr:ABC transporter permease [Cyclobacteriaceae bacterium]
MLKSYFITGLRNLLKQKFYSFINILGLTVGLTCSTLIFLYVSHELSYDKFHADYENTYRVGITGSLAGQTFNAVVACAPMAQTIQEEFPEVESAIRLNSWDNVLISYEDKAFTEENILLADSNFFEFFNFKLIEGDPSTALTGVNKIVVSEDAAIKYFNWKGPGDSAPLGKIIHLGTGDRTCEVTGIVENMPSNSHIPYDMVFSMVSWDQSKSTAWVSNNFYTYFKKRPDVPIEETQEK